MCPGLIQRHELTPQLSQPLVNLRILILQGPLLLLQHTHLLFQGMPLLQNNISVFQVSGISGFLHFKDLKDFQGSQDFQDYRIQEFKKNGNLKATNKDTRIVARMKVLFIGRMFATHTALVICLLIQEQLYLSV
jgi:hypothetical protein